jgi:hypothetical protein
MDLFSFEELFNGQNHNKEENRCVAIKYTEPEKKPSSHTETFINYVVYQLFQLFYLKSSL